MELLIGVAIGLFVLAGASIVASGQMVDNRRLLLETQVQQDMRAAMDIMTRDIRRSGYYERAYEAVAPAATTDPSSVVSAYAPATVSDSTEVLYNWSHDRDNAEPENNAVDSDEFNGFRWNSGNGTIEVRLGANTFQALTDPNVLKITSFNASAVTQTVALPCPTGACVSATGCGNRSLTMNIITIAMSGEAVHDPSVKRSLVGTVRVRNDRVCI
ncbi:MAG: hypothetical protein HY855_17590 [Burkholderiales bacterium]|nr:hypothetical protein [Burkholderiales bacterium]